MDAIGQPHCAMEVPLEHTKEEETSVANVLLVVAPLVPYLPAGA
jgi:hypothetical protein